MKVIELLDNAGVHYEVSMHSPVFTAQQIAAVEHEPGRCVAKPVIINADGDDLMCVLAAPDKVDLVALKGLLNAESVELVDESRIGELFEDCQLGAEPPFGNLYGLATYMDKTLEKDEHIMFQAGTHDKAVRMSMQDYMHLARPRVLDFSCHVIL